LILNRLRRSDPEIMKRVAFISHASVLNGAPITVAELVEEFLTGPEPEKFYLGLPIPGPLLDRYSIKPGHLFFYDRAFLGREAPVTRPRIRNRLRRIFREKEIDLVVANSLESFRAVQAASELKIPVIWMIHELLTAYQKRRELNEMKDVARAADRLIFNSRAALSGLPVLGKGLEKKSRVIYLGIHLASPVEDKSDHRKELGFPPGSVLLGSVGDICPQKGYESLIRAFGLLSRQYPEARLLIIGRTPPRFIKFRNRMNELSRELGIAEKIIFTGEKIDPRNFINSLDLLIHPSWRESFGRVIVEALAREIPVVATRSGGAEEIIVDGETGILIPQREPEAIAGAVSRLIESPEEAREMARRGRAMVEEKFTISRSAAELKEEIARFNSGNH